MALVNLGTDGKFPPFFAILPNESNLKFKTKR
jgi:hypothetical protein